VAAPLRILRGGRGLVWCDTRGCIVAAILIVDDDPTIRMMFARALGSLGEVEQAGNGAEALRLLGAKRYGIILLDLHMPVIDGFVILHTLASKPGPNRETSVYVITADVSEQARVRALRRHAVFLLTKPVPIATLVALVDSALKKAAIRAAAPAEDGDDGPPTSKTPLTPGRKAPSPASSARGRMTPPVRPAAPAGSKKPGG
jgi:CheY-like chemotaxis protein